MMRQMKQISEAIEVTEREDGQSALELVKEKPSEFDMLILDNEMPNLTGLDLILSIREHELKNKLVRVPILCTISDANLH